VKSLNPKLPPSKVILVEPAIRKVLLVAKHNVIFLGLIDGWIDSTERGGAG
jgi:hypothetical protein